MGAPTPPPYPPPYPGTYIAVTPEGLLTKRNLWAVNAIALLMIWLAVLIRLWAGDPAVRGFAQFLVATAVLIGSGLSLAGALGSKRTTDMQNLGLFLWSGFLIVGAAFLVPIVR